MIIEVLINSVVVRGKKNRFDSYFWRLTLLKYLVAQMIKNLPAMQETQVRSLDQKYPLEKGNAVHYSILVWRIPWTEESGGL